MTELEQKIAHLQELQTKHRRNIRELEKQIAIYAGTPPLELLNKLEHVQEQLRQVENQLAELMAQAGIGEVPANYGIKILSPREGSTVEIGGWFELTGTFEETPPSDRAKLFKLPSSGNYWSLINIEIDFNYGVYGEENKWRAVIPVRGGKSGHEVEYIVAILGDKGLIQWNDYENLPHKERYGIKGNPFDDTIVCDRVTVKLVSQPTVFISYAREDLKAAKRLYADLKKNGAEPWLDEESLLPGQNWKVEIKRAIRENRYFLALLSSNSVSRKGYVHKEMVEALETLDEFPESEIFIIPARLDDCSPSHERLRDLHWVDMFPSWTGGLKKILRAIGL